MTERNDISNIYWNQRLGPWSDLQEVAEESRQRIAERGANEDEVRALVQEHGDLLASATKTAGPSQT